MKTKMKTKLTILMAACGLLVVPMLKADENGHDHADHDHAKAAHAHPDKKAGPNGGRVIVSVEPHVEFLVTADRKLQLTFLGADGKAVAAAEQGATAIGGDRSKPTRFKFEKSGDVLVSDVALPDGGSVPLVLMLKATPDSKTVTEKFNVNMAVCPGCKLHEYACVCDHDEGAHGDHSH